MDDANSRLEWRNELVCDIIREPPAQLPFYHPLFEQNLLQARKLRATI